MNCVSSVFSFLVIVARTVVFVSYRCSSAGCSSFIELVRHIWFREDIFGPLGSKGKY